MPFRRNWLTGCAWCLLAVAAARAQPTVTLTADIAPQPLYRALDAFAAQTGLQVIYFSEVVGARKSRGAKAGVSASAALEQLLDGTGLDFEFVNDRTVSIVAASVQPAGYRYEPPPVPTAEPRSRFPPLEEIIVTSSRREEAANRVPMSIAVWTEEAMEASGIKDMTEIAALTPGVEYDFLTYYGAGFYTNLAIRGVNNGKGTTTGIYVDDTPIPAAQGDTFGRSFPVTFDLDRVEVLRGPQGTLLGQGSMGGAIRFILAPPSLTDFTGLLRTELAATDSGDASYEVGAAAGGPLVRDVVGYRVSAWYRSDGGIVDRIDPFSLATLDENANRSSGKSLRGAVTFAPSDSVRITPAVVYQSLDTRDSPAFYTYLSDPEGGVLKNGRLLRQPFDDAFTLASLKLTADLEKAELSSVTSSFHRTADAVVDATNYSAFGGWGNPLGYEYPVSHDNAVLQTIDLGQDVFSEEIRLTSADPDASVTWLAGAFYSHERTDEELRTVSGPIPPGVGPFDIHEVTRAHETQIAGFGQIAYRMKNRVTASVGVRIERVERDAAVGDPLAPLATADDTIVAPRFSLSYQADVHNLLYATMAKGYGRGFINTPVDTNYCGPIPTSVAADTLWSYEIGSKNTLLHGRMQLDTSVFHLRWADPQLRLQTPHTSSACRYGGNVGSAVSTGIELSARALVTDRVNAGLGIAYADAHYAETVKLGDDVIVSNGDAIGTIPAVASPWNITASIEYAFPLATGATVSLSAQDVFHSRNRGPFDTDNPESPYYSPDRRPDPSTNILYLRADISWSSFDVALFINNVLDSTPTVQRRNICCSDTLFFATTLTPRTGGVTATWRF